MSPRANIQKIVMDLGDNEVKRTSRIRPVNASCGSHEAGLQGKNGLDQCAHATSSLTVSDVWLDLRIVLSVNMRWIIFRDERGKHNVRCQ